MFIYDLIFKIFVAAIEFWDLIKDTLSIFLWLVIFLSIILRFAGFPEVSKTLSKCSTDEMPEDARERNRKTRTSLTFSALMMRVCTYAYTRHRPTRSVLTDV